MQCDEIQGMLAGRLADELSPAQEEFLQLHLTGCPQCQASYADLTRTRNDLHDLATDYHPQLSGRISRAIASRRAGITARRWTGLAVRIGGLAAAMLLVVYAVLQVPGLRSAGTPPAQVYVIEGRDLMQIDLATGSTRRMGDLHSPGGRFLGGNLIRSAGLTEVSPSGIPVDLTLPMDDSELLVLTENADAVLRDGSSLWLVYNHARPGDEPLNDRAFEGPGGFVLDRFDLQTGAIDQDPSPKEGVVQRALLSPDGKTAYLLAQLTTSPGPGMTERTTYVKVVDLASRRLITAHRLTSGFGSLAQLHLSPDGARLYVTDLGRLMAIDLAAGTVAFDLEVDGVTATATLNPAGDRLLIATLPDLIVLDTATGTELYRGRANPHYSTLIWRGDWIYGHRYGGIDLIDPQSLKVVKSVPITVYGGWYIP